MSQQVSKTIITNKKAKFDYELTETFEAGLVLEGWEVKSLREGQVSLRESFVVIKDFEGWLHNVNISPLISKSTHYKSTPTRTRKLLLNTNEIKKIKVHIEQKGLTCVCLSMYWKRHLVGGNPTVPRACRHGASYLAAPVSSACASNRS